MDALIFTFATIVIIQAITIICIAVAAIKFKKVYELEKCYFYSPKIRIFYYKMLLKEAYSDLEKTKDISL